MITLRRAQERGHTVIDWLDSYHTFSFGEYDDPQQNHFRTLRVINEDHVKPGAGFRPHSHQNMEIVTYVLEGALEHKDSLGNGSVIKPGDIQRMSAGTGVTHSEFNPSQKEPVHFLQIWILPEKKGLEPSYEQMNFPVSERQNRLSLIASKKGNHSIALHQDVQIYSSILNPEAELAYSPKSDRYVWIQMAKGSLRLNEVFLKAGDGAAIEGEKLLHLQAKEDTELLLFDLA